MASTTSTHYTRTAIALHWAIAILLIGQLFGGKIMMWMEPGSGKYELFQLHKSFGITILLLSVLRLIWRLTHKAPGLPQGMKSWEKRAAHFTHWGFYFLILAIPLSGWAIVSSAEQVISTRLFKIVPWPDISGLPRSEALEGSFSQAHEVLAWAAALLIALHVGAALKHYFINKDNVLARMLPFLKRTSQ